LFFVVIIVLNENPKKNVVARVRVINIDFFIVGKMEFGRMMVSF